MTKDGVDGIGHSPVCQILLQIVVRVPTGSPSPGGDVAVDVFDINQPSLSTPFHSVLVSVSVFMALSTVFHSIQFSQQLSALSLCSSGPISALLVLSTI